MNRITKSLLGLAVAATGFFAAPVSANEGGITLDHAPINLHDNESLQRGAQTFVNYCLSCHSAQAMRYNRLTDLGLTEAQIKDNLLLAGEKVGDTMKVSMQAKDAKVWLGAAPPDLSVIARARGADWLYTYLRTYYRDASRPTGWNNLAFDKVGMPHVFWQQQGDVEHRVVEGKEGKEGHEEVATPGVIRTWEVEEHGKDGKPMHVTNQLVLVKAGQLTSLVDGKAKTLEYDTKVADLVAYLVWMGEPSQNTRERIGYGVLLFLLFILTPMAFFLKKEYWRDVH